MTVENFTSHAAAVETVVMHGAFLASAILFTVKILCREYLETKSEIKSAKSKETK